MTGSFVDVMAQTEIFFDSFNILGSGIIIVWIFASIFLANTITERKDERILATIVFLMSGGLLFFANDPGKYLILVVAIVVIIYSMFKRLFKSNRDEE